MKIATKTYQGLITLIRSTARRIPLSLLLDTVGSGPTILYYHAISDARLPHIENLYRYKNSREFSTDIEYLLRNFRPITEKDLYDYALNGKELPPKAFFLTFDDGLKEAYTVIAPILKKKGLSAAFFISSGFIDNADIFFRYKASLLIDRINSSPLSETESTRLAQAIPLAHSKTETDFRSAILSITYQSRHILDQIANILQFDFHEYLKNKKPYLSSEEIRALRQDGFSIGSHSIDHPLYADLPLTEQLRQTQAGTQALEALLGSPIRLFSFPFSETAISDQFFSATTGNTQDLLSFGTISSAHNKAKRFFTRISLERTNTTTGDIISDAVSSRTFRRLLGG